MPPTTAASTATHRPGGSASGEPTAPEGRTAVAAFRAVRPLHWAKNALVVVPAVAAHRAGEAGMPARLALAFVAFSLVASSGYVVNDLFDLATDRSDPHKRHRSFASGALGVGAGAGLAAALLAGGATAALLLPASFRWVLAAYWATTLAYSAGLKRRIALDVLVLAALYTARIYAGAAATGIPVSEWLASFSMFLFLSLAFLKRASELTEGVRAIPGRGYLAGDRDAIQAMGIASGFLSVLVLALYVSSHEVRRLYAHPEWVWALCPVLLYWVSRFWIRARRGEIHGDPLLVALRDPASWAAFAAAVAVLRLAT